ncbi:periphilin-1-like isoform X2 [Mus caroli]|uniref:Periphilin-1-like isoform X2 n=1 Tax=Mus caroli TaxID=10089 RepID=A0A6P7QIR2_MUSCR|nr:periphilin-1-like isoform X2 [Mus caroli]
MESSAIGSYCKDLYGEATASLTASQKWKVVASTKEEMWSGGQYGYRQFQRERVPPQNHPSDGYHTVLNVPKRPPLLDKIPPQVMNVPKRPPLLDKIPPQVVNVPKRPPLLDKIPPRVVNVPKRPPLLDKIPPQVVNVPKRPPLLGNIPPLLGRPDEGYYSHDAFRVCDEGQSFFRDQRRSRRDDHSASWQPNYRNKRGGLGRKTFYSSHHSRDRSSQYARDRSPHYARDRSPQYARDRSPQYTRDRSPQYTRDRSPQYTRDRSPQYTRDRSSHYARDRSSQYARDRSSHYARDRSSQYARDRSPQYARDRSPQYTRDRSSQYARDRSSQYARDRSSQYARDRSSQYARDRFSQYARDRSSQYGRDRSSQYARDRSPHKRDAPFVRESPAGWKNSQHNRSGSIISGRSYALEQSKTHLSPKSQNRLKDGSKQSLKISRDNSSPRSSAVSSSKMLEDKTIRLTEKELSEAESKWANETLEQSNKNHLAEISKFQVRSMAPVVIDQTEGPKSNTANDIAMYEDSQLSSRTKAIISKSKEIEQAYQQNCETFAVVVKMLLDKDPSLEKSLQVALRQNLHEIGERCVEELNSFIAAYDNSQDFGDPFKK